jgi:hypothetical protein
MRVAAPSTQLLCDDIRQNVDEVIREWERLVASQPWFSLPRTHRVDNLPDVVVGLAEASLCIPADHHAHRGQIDAAVQHGEHRREQGIPESMIFTEFHLLRQAIWNYLVGTFGASQATVAGIMRIDMAMTVVTNASMWGYHRPEIEALGKWEEGIARIVASSPLLR